MKRDDPEEQTSRTAQSESDDEYGLQLREMDTESDSEAGSSDIYSNCGEVDEEQRAAMFDELAASPGSSDVSAFAPKDDPTKLFKRQRTNVTVPDPQQVSAVATALYEWIQKQPSDLKFLMLTFGADELSQNAQVHEKCRRRHIAQQSLDKEAFVSMMLKRLEGVP
ncbi:unnamed protein product, partial [Prorocentrum cordatum]